MALTVCCELLDVLIADAFARVQRSLEDATAAFLACDREVARRVVADDKTLDDLYHRIEDLAVAELLNTAETPSPEHLRCLVTVLRIAPELERSGDLVTHIADLGAQRLASWLTPRACDLLAQMGAIGVEMWGLAADAYATRDVDAGDRLRMIDDEIDDLHVSLSAELAGTPVSVPVAIQIGLVARFFERLGDHAVNVTQQLRHLQPLAG